MDDLRRVNEFRGERGMVVMEIRGASGGGSATFDDSRTFLGLWFWFSVLVQRTCSYFTFYVGIILYLGTLKSIELFMH